MALCYTRLFCRRTLGLQHFRCLYTGRPLSVTASHSLKSNGTCVESYDEKNMRLKRPMSPHLTIYQVQLTAMLSITHRATGIILSTYAMFLGLGTLLIPGGIPCAIEMINGMNLPEAAIIGTKVLLAYPATYHTCNGLRHLIWDLGLLLTIKQVYASGYMVVGLATVSAIALALL